VRLRHYVRKPVARGRRLRIAEESTCSQNITNPTTKAEKGKEREIVCEAKDGALASGYRHPARRVAHGPIRGAGALDVLTNGARPDVLVCELAMPKEDGYTALRRLRDLEAARGARRAPSRSIPAIALTELASDEDWLRALSAGFQFHLAEPA